MEPEHTDELLQMIVENSMVHPRVNIVEVFGNN